MAYRKRQSTDGFINDTPRICEAEGCLQAAEYKAPRSKEHLHDYQYFCLPHVQEFNKKWNFFTDMGMDDIEAFMHDAVTGHRPTWRREEILSGGHFSQYEKLQAELERFLNGAYAKKNQKHIVARDKKERDALALLALEAEVDMANLKAAYRKLVKQFHPDLHHGSKEYEEKFKQITEAYYYLKQLYAEND